MQFIEEGGWEERLKKRECAGVCREIVMGFEKRLGEMEFDFS